MAAAAPLPLRRGWQRKGGGAKAAWSAGIGFILGGGSAICEGGVGMVQESRGVVQYHIPVLLQVLVRVCQSRGKRDALRLGS